MRSFLISAAAILVLASGCSDSSDNSPTADSDTTTASPDTSAPPTSAPGTTTPAGPVAFLFTVDGVTGGGSVPIEYTCDGANETPALTIEGVPTNVEELALIVDDPDAPTDSPFVHWAVYGIGPDTTTITDGDPSLTYGTTDAGTDTWFGPCPPPGDGLHTYRWKLFGLSTAMDLEPALDGRALEAAIVETVVTDSLLIASYQRAE